MFRPGLAQKPWLWLGLRQLRLSREMGQAKATTHGLAPARLGPSRSFWKRRYIICHSTLWSMVQWPRTMNLFFQFFCDSTRRCSNIQVLRSEQVPHSTVFVWVGDGCQKWMALILIECVIYNSQFLKKLCKVVMIWVLGKHNYSNQSCNISPSSPFPVVILHQLRAAILSWCHGACISHLKENPSTLWFYKQQQCWQSSAVVHSAFEDS